MLIAMLGPMAFAACGWGTPSAADTCAEGACSDFCDDDLCGWPGAGQSGAGGATGTGGGISLSPSCDGVPDTPASCTTDASTMSTLPRTPLASLPAGALSAAVAANNAFTVELYQRLLADPATASGNIVSSPLAASVALTMAYAGAAGATATEMATALHFADAASAMQGQNALLQTLTAREASAYAAGESIQSCTGDYRVRLADAFWGEATYTWRPSFLDALAQNYGTGVDEAEFAGSDAARRAINASVSCETDGRVPGLLPPASLDDCTVMVLVNALLLRLPWATPFDVSATAPATFTNGAGKVVTATFMNQTSSLAYVDDGTAQIVALPLVGGELALVVAMPHGSLAAYEASLAPGAGPLAIPAATANIRLSLPTFSLYSPTLALDAPLQAMGVVQAFDGTKADFSGLVSAGPTRPSCCPPKIAIAHVLQQATLVVAEPGVDAFVDPPVVHPPLDLDGGPPAATPVVVNRPFVFSIVDATGAVLFIGHVQDPAIESAGVPFVPVASGC